MAHSHGLSEKNARFWDEPCGSHLASTLGIKEFTSDSLSRFDDNYFDYYDYLKDHIAPYARPGIEALEVGLGFGSVGQYLAEAGCAYTGMDIAAAPVEIMNARLALHGLPGQALRGDFLANDFEDGRFGLVVSIGCLHHTGDLPRAIDEVERLLAPGGTAVIMLYNRFSYRQWQKDFAGTLAGAVKSLATGDPGAERDIDKFPACYDTNAKGDEAPFTEFTAVSQAKRLFRRFDSVAIKKQNCADEVFFGKTFLRDQIRPVLGRLCGLDLYITATKKR